jgi:hypothetical protein
MHNEEYLLGVQQVDEREINNFILRETDILVSMSIANLIYAHGETLTHCDLHPHQETMQ